MKTITLILVVVSVVFQCGCSTYGEDARQAKARASHQRSSQAQDIQMLKDRLSGIALAQEHLSTDIMELKKLVAGSAAETKDVNEKLNRAVKGLEERDVKMQKETIQALSVKIAEIMKAQVSSSGGVSGSGVEHVVKPGQTLSAIAQAYGVTVSAIVKANKIADPNNVKVGKKLFIPQ